ncbi:MAG: cytochrome c-type biogenesis protein CcmH [Alphaproteobacteria bacterium]|nr:MAG: cytochrome c-type biogenesis protein CcmH [Alphaproteobacteria bacterium]
MLRILVLVLGLLSAHGALAVQPDEMLADPALEARAREISKGLRCLVCQNESIDDSNAELARDLRILVRERLLAGDSDEEVVQYIVDRYGEFVLLRPTARGANILLWISGPLMLAVGIGLVAVYLRRRALGAEPTPKALTEDEKRRLEDILRS